MDRTTTSADLRDTLYGAMELSKNTWLLAIQFPDRPQPSLYPIAGGNTEDLVAKLIAASDRWAKVSGKRPSITLCYEAGYDAFWLARFLKTVASSVWWWTPPACRSIGADVGPKPIGSTWRCCCVR